MGWIAVELSDMLLPRPSISALVTVSTQHIALVKFTDKPRDWHDAVNATTDFEGLTVGVAMVELHHYEVTLTTVNATTLLTVER
jgi:hypothetical protein